MLSSELKALLDKYLEDTITQEEFSRLWESLRTPENEKDWHEVTESLLRNTSLHRLADEARGEQLLHKVRARMEPSTAPEHFLAELPTQRLNLYRLLQYAAIILTLAGVGYYYIVASQTKKVDPVIVNSLKKPAELPPGGQRASLTLSDGSVVLLDSEPNGQIARQGHVQVVKLANGQLQYRVGNDAAAAATALYNTMSTPRGGQYQLQLPDGSTVWLNAESSITYPIAFTPEERRVRITGEAYFEVTKDARRPFRVVADDLLVEVLGTHFNINAYANEGRVKTSLLEGTVKVNHSLLKPGQAYLDGKVVPTDTEQDVAWKNGVFNFNDQDLAQVMRQLARWYNLEVVYAPGVPKKEYGGEMGRNLTLQQVLKGLENSGLHFELDGRRLTVKP